MSASTPVPAASSFPQPPIPQSPYPQPPGVPAPPLAMTAGAARAAPMPPLPPTAGRPPVAGAAVGPNGAAGTGEPAPAEDLVPAIGFMQQPWVQNVLPLVTSLVAHAVLIVLGLTVAVAAGVIPAPKMLQEEQTIIAEATIADAGPPGGVQNVGANDDPLKQAMQDQTVDGGTASGFSDKQGPAVDPSAGGGGDSTDSGLIGLGSGGFKAGGGTGGKGAGVGGGAGDGGPLAQFGAPGGGAIGPKGPVFGNGGNALKIVFVCDATGTMINKFGTLKRQLNDAISKLKPIQSYNVVFYADSGKFFMADNGGLIMANADNKLNTYAFLDKITAVGQTDPIPALEAAFKQQPQLLYFLSDGEFANLRTYKQVTDAINRFNAGKRTKINTILFDTYDEEAAEVMKKIAVDNGGKFNYVKEADLE
ncbi:MAG: marine proteobacterial sortase target protein [Phycisphaerales bacterium]|nr:marine proteobacterial sortase target protein [Phycisphaerales bacterium]